MNYQGIREASLKSQAWNFLKKLDKKSRTKLINKVFRTNQHHMDNRYRQLDDSEYLSNLQPKPKSATLTATDHNKLQLMIGKMRVDIDLSIDADLEYIKHNHIRVGARATKIDPVQSEFIKTTMNQKSYLKRRSKFSERYGVLCARKRVAKKVTYPKGSDAQYISLIKQLSFDSTTKKIEL